jgi:hypothetical protein
MTPEQISDLKLGDRLMVSANQSEKKPRVRIPPHPPVVYYEGLSDESNGKKDVSHNGFHNCPQALMSK